MSPTALARTGLRPMNRPDTVPEQLKERALEDLPGRRNDAVESGQLGKRRARSIWLWVLGLALAAAAGASWSEFSRGSSGDRGERAMTVLTKRLAAVAVGVFGPKRAGDRRLGDSKRAQLDQPSPPFSDPTRS